MSPMVHPSAIRFIFVEEQVSARAELLWDVAPNTCRSVSEALPSEGKSHHGIYSGSECVQVLNQVIKIPPENATSAVTKGQVAFTWMAAGSAYGVDQDFAEICWFYDIDAEPRMWGGPVAVNVFAEFRDSPEDFYLACRRMRRDGVKALRIEIVDN